MVIVILFRKILMHIVDVLPLLNKVLNPFLCYIFWALDWIKDVLGMFRKILEIFRCIPDPRGQIVKIYLHFRTVTHSPPPHYPSTCKISTNQKQSCDLHPLHPNVARGYYMLKLSKVQRPSD